ncbi:cytochrome P450 [Arthrobacter crystallopoietes BAB-32]|uniref:Cytochrome P450 n=1 Tax=Arthrobacter crystallopoietes BAB-32 TaxID=1246476 RepID=N1UU08_9MICC|nr:cytochrome P450 [Arthrobacter crystallopoietes]EMY33901.1 cytochrome P450 [Arthrobacter crystallopoietes BAB-32]
MENLQDLERALNPYPFYEQMRESAPVFRDEQTGLWHIFRYDDVERVLSEHATFSSRQRQDEQSETGRLFAASLVNTDPPRHRQLRSLVSQAFTPRAVDALAPRIEAITNDLLDRIAPAGTADLVEALAYPLPVIVIAELMGIPAEDRDRFKKWSDNVIKAAGPDEVLAEDDPGEEASRGEMVEYFLALIERRRQDPGHDLVSALLGAEIDGQQLTVPELVGFCALLLVAGNETTTNLIGNALLSFAGNPGTLERLRAEPGLLPQAIEEVLRYRSPVQAMYRLAAADAELDGTAIPAGDSLVAWIGAANHDPRHFERPEEFDVDRSPNRHLAFGHGVHFCLGSPLARLEARIALQAVLTRLPGIAVVPGAALERVDSTIVFGPKQVPVFWQAT